MMDGYNHTTSPYAVRPDLTQAYISYWDDLARAGSWWTGAERLVPDAVRDWSKVAAAQYLSAALLIQFKPDVDRSINRMQIEIIAGRDNTALQTSRNALLEAAGSQVLVDAAAVAENFQRMVRIADATGIPMGGLMNALSGSITEKLDLHRFASTRHTPQQNTLQKRVGVPVRFLLQRVARAGKR